MVALVFYALQTRVINENTSNVNVLLLRDVYAVKRHGKYK